METGAKIALGIGGLLLAGGIGYAVYAATRPKTTTQLPPPGGPNEPPKGGGFSIDKIKDIYGNLVAATKEAFPMRIGMVGPNVKKLQEALKTKFNKTTVIPDGIFGVRTWTALKELGYVTFVLNTLSEEDFNSVVAGKPKGSTSSADGFGGRGEKLKFAGRVAGANLGTFVGLNY